MTVEYAMVSASTSEYLSKLFHKLYNSLSKLFHILESTRHFVS